MTAKKRRAKRARKFPYAKRAKELRELGFKVSDKSTRGKGKIKETWTAVAGYLNFTQKAREVAQVPKRTRVLSRGEKLPPPKKYRFKFVKFKNADERDSVIESKFFSANQITPKGVFVEIPANVDPRKYKFKVGKSGEIHTTYEERNDVVVRMDAEDFAKDPIATARATLAKFAPEVRKTKKKKRQKKVSRKTPIGFSLLVNGYHSKHRSTSIRQFLYYLQNKLLPDWLENNEEKTEKDFADIFHLRILY